MKRRYFVYIFFLFSLVVYVSSCLDGFEGIGNGGDDYGFCLTCGSSGSNSEIIDIKDDKFSPDTLSVKQGMTVIWYNRDLYTHIVTSDDKVTFNSDSIFRKDTVGPSSSYSYLTSVVGNFKYHCGIHPRETGVLIVK